MGRTDPNSQRGFRAQLRLEPRTPYLGRPCKNMKLPKWAAHVFLYLFLLLLNLFILFIYFWLRWVFVAARGLFLAVASGAYSSLQCAGFSLRWLLLLRSTGSRRAGSVVVACRLWSTGSVVVAHGLSCSAACGILLDQGSNLSPCIGRRILNHCATREVPLHLF